ncbi:hypothetical protein CEXT_17711 [Caerostris extrusa]|uniref:Uncharacterized protein n=1 Tax=Caerostris extrusa TaxID=172846 RepID=A0AAV4XSC8_CAEEX|nr:hypothetical protein CEXT_17711 [Caerostris extrusa]
MPLQEGQSVQGPLCLQKPNRLEVRVPNRCPRNLEPVPSKDLKFETVLEEEQEDKPETTDGKDGTKDTEQDKDKDKEDDEDKEKDKDKGKDEEKVETTSPDKNHVKFQEPEVDEPEKPDDIK